MKTAGFIEPLKRHIQLGKPFLGICVGFQALFESSGENQEVQGLGILPGCLGRFNPIDKSVPHVGWNGVHAVIQDIASSGLAGSICSDDKFYFVHSYAVPFVENSYASAGWTVATTTYGSERFISAISKDNVFATQFHPEKSGEAGLRVLRSFLSPTIGGHPLRSIPDSHASMQGLTRRVIACLDVRSNDDGDLVVTKGDQYDVRERDDTSAKVRNLGKPVDMAQKYYIQGADEIIFLNITSFRDCPLYNSPMLEVLRRTAGQVFVPLTVGGGISATTDDKGRSVSALEVATQYFKSGADKVSIGSDAVYATERYLQGNQNSLEQSSIEQISAAYGNQAVIISIDPRKVFVDSPDSTPHHTIKTKFRSPTGQEYCWYQCTVKGGREVRDIDARQLAQTAEKLGAGEVLLNSIDKDGSNSGFDLELINDIKDAVSIPVIASSGAGQPRHFTEVFAGTKTDAALGAGMVRLLRPS